MGRIGVDLYPEQVGVHLEDVSMFSKFLGGSPTNVAVAAARHGRRTRGDHAHRRGPLRDATCTRRCAPSTSTTGSSRAVPDLRTPVTFCEIFPPDDFPLYFYRFPTAPDLQIRADELDLEAIAAADIFWVTVTGLCQEPSRSATMAALAARGGHGLTVLDLDYRPMFWASAEAAHPHVRAALEHADVAVGNREECEVAVGEREPERAAPALLAAGVQLAVVKQGPAGSSAYAATSRSWCRRSR